MTLSKKILLLFLWFNFVVISISYGQKQYTKADVRALFPSNTKDLWINQLSGSLNQKHAVEMIIGTDGHVCKGLYTLKNSRTTFFFEGEDKNHQLSLVELNGDMRASGFIFGHYDGSSFEGKWTNTDKTIELDLNLKFSNQLDTNRHDIYSTSFWRKLYIGEIENKEVELHLIKNGASYEVITNEEGFIGIGKTLGADKKIEALAFEIPNSILSGKWIFFDTTEMDKVTIIHQNTNKTTSVMQLNAKLDYMLYEYADYYTRLECVQPVTSNKKFNLWLEGVMKESLHENEKKIKQLNKEESSVKERWLQTVDVWVEVDFFSKDLISGTLFSQSSLKNETKKTSFIYDFKNSKLLNLQDIFSENFNSKSYFTKLIPDLRNEIHWPDEQKKWIEKQSFEFITLKNSGICFKTSFDSIFGEAEIVVDYNDVGQYLKLKDLLKNKQGR